MMAFKVLSALTRRSAGTCVAKAALSSVAGRALDTNLSTSVPWGASSSASNLGFVARMVHSLSMCRSRALVQSSQCACKEVWLNYPNSLESILVHRLAGPHSRRVHC